jgi:hypothetical protein
VAHYVTWLITPSAILLMWLIENGDKSPPHFDGAIFTSQLQHAKALPN